MQLINQPDEVDDEITNIIIYSAKLCAAVADRPIIDTWHST